MSQTWALYENALKEVWTQDHFESQIYNKNPFLERIEKTDAHTIGDHAAVPILTTRNGGYSAVPSSGSSSLNAAGNVGINKATYNLTYHYQQVAIEHAAIVSSEGGGATAVASVIDTEMSGASDAIRKQLTRQAYTNGDSLLATCGTTTSSVVVALSAVSGHDAIQRRWLYKGLTVDIGTSTSEASLSDAVTVTAVTDSATAPTITVSGSAITTTSSNFVSIANARAGTTAYEMNGLQNLIGTGTVGAITTASEPEWQPGVGALDSTTTDLTLDSMLAVQEAIQQASGIDPTDVITSKRQMRRFYNLFQNQVRFQTDSAIAVGSVGKVEWNGMTVQGDVDCPTASMFFLNLDDFLLVKGSRGMHWAADVFGGGGNLNWTQGTTAFKGVLAYPVNVAVRRRNTSGRFSALT